MPARTTPRRLLVTLAMAIGCLSPIAIAVPAEDNAALRYWRAIWLMGEDTPSSAIHYEGLYDPNHNHAPEGEDPYPSSQLLEDKAEVIGLLIEASLLEDCDFGVDYHNGVEATLPHLSPMRKSAQLLMLDARRLLAEGNTDAATERIAAGYRLAEHMTGDRTLINALVSIACFSLVDGVVSENAQAFTPENRRTIAAALTRFDAEDPFGCVRAVRSEAELFGGWMLQRIDNQWATPESFAADVAMLTDDPDNPGGLLRTFYSGDRNDQKAFQKALRAQLDQYSTALHLMADAWNTPEAEQSLQAIGEKITEGSFGALAQLMAPALTRVHRNDTTTRDLLTDRLNWATNR
jgi:hypothetical protein